MVACSVHEIDHIILNFQQLSRISNYEVWEVVRKLIMEIFGESFVVIGLVSVKVDFIA